MLVSFFPPEVALQSSLPPEVSESEDTRPELTLDNVPFGALVAAVAVFMPAERSGTAVVENTSSTRTRQLKRYMREDTLVNGALKK